MFKNSFMKNFKKIVLLLSIGIFIGSCSKNSEFVDIGELVPDNNKTPLISLSATIINNDLTEIDLFDETATNEAVTINGHNFCYGTDANSYAICNEQNINNFENVFGEIVVFKVGNTEMNFYCPEMIYFNAPQTINPNTGFDITWNVDQNINNEVLISIIPRLDGNGNPYTSQNTNRIDILVPDNGQYAFYPHSLSGLNSGDIVDIEMRRTNQRNFIQYYLESFSVNVHIVVVQ